MSLKHPCQHVMLSTFANKSLKWEKDVYREIKDTYIQKQAEKDLDRFLETWDDENVQGRNIITREKEIKIRDLFGIRNYR